MNIITCKNVGAEVSEVDLRQLSDEQFQAIQAAFVRHGLLFFRDQRLSELDHIAFAERWGDININRFFKAHREHPEIALVEKEPDQQQNIGGGWHTDHSYDEVPALGSILAARELPPEGGDTWFVSAADAFDRLDPPLKNSLIKLTATHSGKHVFGSTSPYAQAQHQTGRLKGNDQADELPDPVHPVVISHPLSGRATLYINPGFTVRINELSESESAAMLDRLYGEMIRDQFVEKFEWKPGSIAFWDNRATWHFAQNDYQGHRREMHRITIEGEPLRRYISG